MAGWLSERSRNGSVDEIPLPAASGQLWLCGKHFVGPDPAAALERTGATAVVCLNEVDEIGTRYPRYVRWLRDHAPDRAVWWPIPDLHPPPAAEVQPFLVELHGRLVGGDGLLVSCGAGVGRAGTVAAALLIIQGAGLDEALAVVGSHRPAAGPQTRQQRAFLEDLATGVPYSAHFRRR
jgi:protein-tyrosine phosphatase